MPRHGIQGSELNTVHAQARSRGSYWSGWRAAPHALARPGAQASATRDYLHSLNQNGETLPDGPVIISPDGLFPSLYRELARPSARAWSSRVYVNGWGSRGYAWMKKSHADCAHQSCFRRRPALLQFFELALPEAAHSLLHSGPSLLGSGALAVLRRLAWPCCDAWGLFCHISSSYHTGCRRTSACMHFEPQQSYTGYM